MSSRPTLRSITAEVVGCRLCPRLVAWREQVAREKVRRFAGEEYWGKPVPAFGDQKARLALVGLAPAAHGGNRTGRMFTGDRSGDWLYRALHRAGFAGQEASLHADDGMVLTDCFITATARCAPPLNRLLPEEIRNCRPFLVRELALLTHLRVVVGLGTIGFRSALEALRELGRISFDRVPAFAHAAEYRFGDLSVIASYHPSQQNTFTGRLTEPMLDRVFRLARRRIDGGGGRG